MAESKKYYPPELLTRQHDRSGFDCGSAPLDEYLKRYALQNQKKDVARTYVVARENRVVGFYTLAFGAVSHEEATLEIKQGVPKYPIRVVLLARLAVDLNEKGRGLGRGLLQDALLRIVQAADIAGLRAVLVNAKDEAARRFYERYGLESSPVNDFLLMLSVAEIRVNLS